MFFKSGESVSFVPMSSEMESFFEDKLFQKQSVNVQTLVIRLICKNLPLPYQQKVQRERKNNFLLFWTQRVQSNFFFRAQLNRICSNPTMANYLLSSCL